VRRLAIGISTCPNDTFAFHALLEGLVRIDGIELDFELADVEELNRGMLADRFDACKVSAHAALLASERIAALDVGWALGHDVGPVVLAAPGTRRADVDGGPHVLCPGELTTATLLWRLFHPEEARLEQRVFSEIMPALARGEADLGVCIHEGRFTWRERGLELVEDLGTTWGARTGSPLPLGGIVVRRSLEPDATRLLADGIRASLAWAEEHRTESLVSMRRHAQEESEDVLWGHVDLYVNAWTRALGAEGRAALAALSALAGERGLLPPGGALEIR
jgi:1,4-dihydroxy-6-naphthoate synthase